MNAASAEALNPAILETLNQILTEGVPSTPGLDDGLDGLTRTFPEAKVRVTKTGPFALRIGWDVSALGEIDQLKATSLLGRLFIVAATAVQLSPNVTMQLASTVEPKPLQ